MPPRTAESARAYHSPKFEKIEEVAQEMADASLEHPAPASKVSFEVPRDLRREFAGAIAARNEADGRARAAREIADRADRLMREAGDERLKTELEAAQRAATHRHKVTLTSNMLLQKCITRREDQRDGR